MHLLYYWTLVLEAEAITFGTDPPSCDMRFACYHSFKVTLSNDGYHMLTFVHLGKLIVAANPDWVDH